MSDGSSTRTVEVIRVGTVGLDKEYPSKTAVRLRDLSAIYEGGPLKGLNTAKRSWKGAFRTGRTIGEFYDVEGKRLKEAYRQQFGGQLPPEVAAEIDRSMEQAVKAQGLGKPLTVENLRARRTIQFEFLPPSIKGNTFAVEDLYERLKGKRLAGINVHVWDQISGAYLGARNTDKNGTLILPTDAQFVEVLQWQLAGGGYSDCFNGERAAGMPGLLFYFPANEGSGGTLYCFSGVSGQQASWSGNWYDEGFFNRPALKVFTDSTVVAVGAEPEGRRSFQFLWYCSSVTDTPIFSYSGGFGVQDDFGLRLASSKLQGRLAAGAAGTQAGTTTIQTGKWYLLQINTQMFGRWNPNASPTPAYEYLIQMDVYLGGALELTVSTFGPPKVYVPSSSLSLNNAVYVGGNDDDGLDEIRHLDRELYSPEITNYASFLKNGRVDTRSKGSLGSPGW